MEYMLSVRKIGKFDNRRDVGKTLSALGPFCVREASNDVVTFMRAFFSFILMHDMVV